MEKTPNNSGRSRVHFNASNNDEAAEPTVNIASFDPDPDSELDTDEGKSSVEGVMDEDGQTRDITEAKTPSSFYFAENDELDKEDRRTSEDNEYFRRFLQFKSHSAPTSPQPSPIPSPKMSPEHRGSDIPLVDLTATRTESQPPLDSRQSNAGTIVERGQEKRDSFDSPGSAKREADRVIKEHTRWKWPKENFRRVRSGDLDPSGASTPEDEGYARHYTLNSGVLTNLLRLYVLNEIMI
jgi:hypothetical protein